MANSRLGIETKAITEGALMAALTALLALAGIYIPAIDAIVMLIWTLPVVIVCMRHGIRAGAATLVVAGFVIMMVSTPINAVTIMIRSAGTALMIGYGFSKMWRMEKTVLYTTGAEITSLVIDVLLSVFVMGFSIKELFTFEPEMVEEMAQMFTEAGIAASMGLSAEQMAAEVERVFVTMSYIMPATMLIYCFASAITNYAAAYFILRKLKMPLPAMIKLSTFRLPTALIFGFIFGYGLTVLGNSLWPETPMIVTVGQNIIMVFLAFYIVQGLGLIQYLIGRAPSGMRVLLRFGLIFLIIMTAFGILTIIGYIGIADALLDFRKMGALPAKKE